MKDETSSSENPIGLYRDSASGTEIGAIDPVQADAYVRLGYKLVKEGREAAMKPQAEMDGAAPVVEGGETYTPKKKEDK